MLKSRHEDLTHDRSISSEVKTQTVVCTSSGNCCFTSTRASPRSKVPMFFPSCGKSRQHLNHPSSTCFTSPKISSCVRDAYVTEHFLSSASSSFSLGAFLSLVLLFLVIELCSPLGLLPSDAYFIAATSRHHGHAVANSHDLHRHRLWNYIQRRG